jgi:ribonucleotide monophosphatase NagD (HAD superfamily)
LSTSTTPPTPINTLGKPSVSFFKTTVASLSLPSASSSSSSSSEGKSEPEYSAIGIVGDDWKNDLGGGARELGLRRCLVRTGKWREGDLEKAREGEDGGVKGEVTEWENFQELVEEILKG